MRHAGLYGKLLQRLTRSTWRTMGARVLVVSAGATPTQVLALLPGKAMFLPPPTVRGAAVVIFPAHEGERAFSFPYRVQA